MSLDCVPAVPTSADAVLVHVRVITEAGWPVAFWEGADQRTVLGVVRSWQGAAPSECGGGWCVYYEVRVRDRGAMRLLLAIQCGSWYLEAG